MGRIHGRQLVSVLLVFVCANGGAAFAQAPSIGQRMGPSSALVGTWRLVEFWDRDSTTGALVRLYGEKPTGYFIYDATGHVSIQIMRGPDPFGVDPARGEAWFLRATPAELQGAIEHYRAYFGTYGLDSVAGFVVHQVEGDSRGLYTGTRQRRQYRLAGDSLIIGNEVTTRRVLLRVPGAL